MVLVEPDRNGGETAYYTRGSELISQERNGEISYYLYDGFMSVRGLANQNGNVTDTYSYDAWGNLISSTGSTTNTFLYRGEQLDNTTGFYYLRARYMNPSTGTFINMDTYQGSIFEPVTLHKYLYANANPVMYCDPSGNMATLGETIIANAIQNMIIGGIAGFIGGGISALMKGESFIGGAVTGLLQGALAGAMAGILGGGMTALALKTGLSLGGSIAIGAIVGAFSGFSSNLVAQITEYCTKNHTLNIYDALANVSFEELGIAALMGAGFGAMSGGLFYGNSVHIMDEKVWGVMMKESIIKALKSGSVLIEDIILSMFEVAVGMTIDAITILP